MLKGNITNRTGATLGVREGSGESGENMQKGEVQQNGEGT